MAQLTKRSATDILLAIETQIEIMTRRLQNVENLQKIIVSWMNDNRVAQRQQNQQQPQRQVREEFVNKENFDARQRTSAFAQAAAQHGVDVGDPDFDNKVHVRHDEPAQQPRVMQMPDPEPNEDGIIESPVRGNARGQRGPKRSKKPAVSQIVTQGDYPLYVAAVEILNEDGSLINQTRTDTKGRWRMPLPPGEYQVHVSKRFPPDSGRAPVDIMYPITVPPQDEVELDPISLG